MLARLFHDHPRSVGETYGEHFMVASGFAWKMLVAGLACFIHAVLPGLFVETGSRAIAQLHHRMLVCRTKAKNRASGQGCREVSGEGQTPVEAGSE